MSKTKSTVSIVTVTPKMAKEWLERVPERQRKASPSKVRKWSYFMDVAEWKLSNDAIIFDSDGFLINGQHRLMALLEAGKPQQFIVGRGWSPDTFIIMDRQNTRRTQQFVRGQHSNTLAGAGYYVTLYLRGEYPRPFGACVEPVESLSNIEDRITGPQIQSAVNVIHDADMAKSKIGKLGFLSFLYWYYVHVAQCDKSRVQAFFYGLGTGVGLKSGDPALALRNRVLTTDGRLPSATFEALAIKAIKNHLRGKKMSAPRWLESEAFPALELSA